MKRLIFLSLLILSGCSSKPYAVESPPPRTPSPKNNLIFVTNHGSHTGFVIPAPAMNQELPFLEQRFGQVPFYEFGWGDQDYYQANEATTWLGIGALFWPTNTVVHVVAVPKPPTQYFRKTEVVKVKISDSGYKGLQKFLAKSFFRNQAGNVKTLKKGLYGNSQFYQGTGEYYLCNTCNKWTAKGLESAGMDIWPSCYLTASGIMDFLQEEQPEKITEPSKDAKD